VSTVKGKTALVSGKDRVTHRVIQGDSRSLSFLGDGSIGLVVTSPPYWQIKDYGTSDQIGYGQSLHEYLHDLAVVWEECHRVLMPGRRLVVNIGDQFARTQVYGRYKIIPLHAEIIAQCEHIGFDFMGSIIWQKRTTMNTSGGATIMGSYPFPPNGMVELDSEYVLIFKKQGKGPVLDPEFKEPGRMTKERWKELFTGHWTFGGARKKGHEAPFPVELPHRVMEMFSFPGEEVLDPFLGSGTTLVAADILGRICVGYEINPSFRTIMEERFSGDGVVGNVEWMVEPSSGTACKVEGYVPRIQNARPLSEEALRKGGSVRDTIVVRKVVDGRTLGLDDGRTIRLLGVTVTDEKGSRAYLEEYVRGKSVSITTDDMVIPDERDTEVYVHLKNRIFVNSYMIRERVAKVDEGREFSKKDRFRKL